VNRVISQKCILCNSDMVFPFIIKNKRSFFRCGNCELIFLPKKYHLPRADEISRYRLHENTLSNQGYVNMFLEKISIIKKYCHGIYSVLDYGCGPEPVLAELLRKEGFECDIYDPYFFHELSESEKTYDLVISTEVFEHFRDLLYDLHKISSHLKPGGYLAIMTSFHDSVADLESWWYMSETTHICFFSNRTFEYIADNFGFEIVYKNYKNFIILHKNLPE
jgi:SAM-dependent methyltransferase